MQYSKLPTHQIKSLLDSQNYRHSHHLLLKWRPSLDENRGQVIVSKRAIPKAINRNKAKRRIKSVLNQILPTIKPNIDILLMVKKNVNNHDYSELLKETKILFSKIK